MRVSKVETMGMAGLVGLKAIQWETELLQGIAQELKEEFLASGETGGTGSGQTIQVSVNQVMKIGTVLKNNESI